MDAYFGYNQIAMHPDDQEKTTFIINKANYCYNIMPFGLKNAGATYQRMMNKIFENHIRQSVEVYIDDMIVKSKDPDDHIWDLEQTFEKLRRNQIHLNSAKCAFGVLASKFLGFLLTNHGICYTPTDLALLSGGLEGSFLLVTFPSLLSPSNTYQSFHSKAFNRFGQPTVLVKVK